MHRNVGSYHSYFLFHEKQVNDAKCYLLMSAFIKQRNFTNKLTKKQADKQNRLNKIMQKRFDLTGQCSLLGVVI